MAGEKKVRVTFLEDDDSSSSGKEFAAGKTYSLRPDSAQHYINRKKALPEAEYKAMKAAQEESDDDADAETEESGAGGDDSGNGLSGEPGADEEASEADARS